MKSAASFYSPNRYQPEDSVGYLMRRVLGSILSEADASLASHGLTYVQWLPLHRLAKCGPASAAELARALTIDAAAMTRALDRLESKGLVSRTRSDSDRRVVQIALTPSGSTVADEVPPVLARVLNQHLAGFSRTEWQALLQMLQRMLANGEALREGREGRTA